MVNFLIISSCLKSSLYCFYSFMSLCCILCNFKGLFCNSLIFFFAISNYNCPLRLILINQLIFFLTIIYLFYYYFGCVGSLSLCEGFPQPRRAGATPHRGARASHYCGPSCCGAQAQPLWLTGPAAPRHAGSSQTRDRTRVPRISRQTPNHCATREAQSTNF